MRRPTWTGVRATVVFLGGWALVLYEAIYATDKSPEIIVGGFGLIVGPFVAIPESRAGRHRHHSEEEDA